MFHQLLDELHEMIATLRKQFASAVPVTDENLQELHDKVSAVKDVAPVPASQSGLIGANAAQAASQTDTAGLSTGEGSAAGSAAQV